MDSTAAERDLRLVLAAEHPTANDIVNAGQHVRSLRDQLLDHEVRMLADERALLTREQWTALQDALREDRPSDFNNRRGGYGRGGGRRGGGGGGAGDRDAGGPLRPPRSPSRPRGGKRRPNQPPPPHRRRRRAGGRGGA